MINPAELHLVLNHFPVILPIAGIAVLLGGLAFRSIAVVRAALCLLACGALFTIPTYLTGSPAEALAKNYPEVSRRLIHDHQESGVVSFALLGVAGLYAAALLWASLRRSLGALAMGVMLAFALAASLSVARTAHLGGEIRHEEVRLTDRF